MQMSTFSRASTIMVASVFVLNLLALAPGPGTGARGAVISEFGHGFGEDRYITFPQGGGTDTGTLLEVPAGTTLYSARLQLEGRPSGADSYPAGVTLDVGGDGDLEWAFPAWPGAGALGMQYAFSDGSLWAERTLPPSGTYMNEPVYLPAGARVGEASVSLTGGPEYFFTSRSIDDNGGMIGEMRAGDFDGDGDNDLAVLRMGGGELGWYENMDSAGTTWTYFPIDAGELTSPGNGSGISAFTVTDWDGDGVTDIIACSEGGIIGNFQMTAGSMSGGCPWEYDEVTRNGGEAMWVEGDDMDADGDTDLVVASSITVGGPSQRIGIHLQLTEGDEGGPGVEIVGVDDLDTVFSCTIIDADGNPYPDLVAAVKPQETGLDPMMILYRDPAHLSGGQASGSGRIILDDGGIGSPEALAAADIDCDGMEDIVCLDSPGLAWYVNPNDPGAGSWTEHIISSGVSGGDLALGGISTVLRASPAFPDVAVASPEDDEARWFRNPCAPPDGTHWESVKVASVMKAHQVLLADMDFRGDLDLVSCGGTVGKLDWHDLEHSAPSAVSVSLQGAGEPVDLWEQSPGSGYLTPRGEDATLDTSPLTDALSSSGPAGCVEDGYGNRMVPLTLTISSSTPGYINVSAPLITYTYRPVVDVIDHSTLTDEINSHIEALSGKKGFTGPTVEVPVKVTSATAGELRLFGLELGYNAPPVQTSQPGSVRLSEGGGPVYIGLTGHWSDDRTAPEDLFFQLAEVSAQPGSDGAPGDDAVRVIDGRTLEVDMHGSDFYGELAVTVDVFDDGSPNRDIGSSRSAPVRVIVTPVNDEPVAGAPLASFEMPEGGSSHVMDLCGGGHFTDADGDPLQFSWVMDQADRFDDGLKIIDLGGGRYQFVSEGNWIGGPVPVRVYADDVVPDGVADPRDDLGDRPSQEFSVTVVNSDDDAPYWDPLPAVMVPEDSSWSASLDLHGFVHDSDTPAELISLTVIRSNSWGISAKVGDDGMLWLEPRPDFFGTCLLTLQANDGRSARETVLTVEVAPVNDLPEVRIDTPLRGDPFTLPREDGEGGGGNGHAAVHVSGKASDVEGLKRVTVRMYRPSDGLYTRWYWARGLDNWDVNIPLTDLPGPGEYIIQVRVSDGGAEATASRGITVKPAEDGPEEAAHDGDGDKAAYDPTLQYSEPAAVVPDQQDTRGGGVDADRDVPGTADVGAAAAGVAVLSTILGLVGYLGGTQQGKYTTMGFFFPLYTKLKRKKILDNFTRGRIYEFVRTHPGAHFNEIKRDLDLKNGSLTYHLMTLEREDFVKSRNSGVYKRFYLFNVKVPRRQIIKLSRIQERIVAVILVHPGATQKEIVDITGIKQQTVNRNINQLLDYNAVRVERRGRKTHCFINLQGDPALEEEAGAEARAAPGIQLIMKECPHCGEKNAPLFHGCFSIPDPRDRKDGVPAAA